MSFFARARAGVAALAAAVLVALSAAACTQEIKAIDYDQSCTKASDCVPIQEGGQPSCCGFNDCGDNAAINKADFQQYLSDYEAAAGSCEGQACPAVQCAPAPVACLGGKCQLAPFHP
jgi:hypothetical protein